MTEPPQIASHGIFRKIAAPPAQVFRYFTRAQELHMWLSESGTHFEAHPGGICVLTISRDYKVYGLVESIDPDKSLTINAGTHHIDVQLRPAKNDTKVIITLKGPQATIAAKTEWKIALDNLESMLSTGYDLRTVRRPMLGVLAEALEPDKTLRAGLPVHHGLYVTGLVANTGTRQAGLQAGDIIVAADSRKLHSRADLLDVLYGKQIGDVLTIDVLRGEHKQLLKIPLTPRQLPELPPNAEFVAHMVKEETGRLMWLIAESCDGLSEADAARRPTANEWSVAEVLAHLILTERDRRYNLDSIFANSQPFEPQVNMAVRPERLQAVIAACGDLWGLLDTLRSEYNAARVFIANLPKNRLVEPAYFRSFAEAFSYDHIHYHGEEHLAQIRDAVRAVRGGQSGPYFD